MISRIDSHIAAVRNKLAFGQFLVSAAQALLVVALAALAYAIMRQFTLLVLPHEKLLLPVGVGLCAVYGLIVAIRRRPKALMAAVAIDDRLGLQEKFSTAIYARDSQDAFAAAALLDAENAATGADLRRKFPLARPRAIVPAILVGLVAAGLFVFVEPRNLLASESAVARPKPVDVKETQQAKEAVKQTIAQIDQAPKAAAEKESIKLAKGELAELLKKPDFDPAVARRKALSALQDLNATTEQIKSTQRFAEAKKQDQLMQKLDPGKDQTGPVADAQRELSKGNFNGAIGKLDEVTKKFDQMSEPQKEQAAQQMQQMAKQLQQMAGNPQAQQHMQQQMQQMGLRPQQAQQAQKLMQQAAQGNQQAAQQLQQMAQQAMKQMNGGQGPTQQQQAQAQQMMKQMQAQANGQQQAAQLQQAAQAMAQAMKQGAGQQQAGQQQAQRGQQRGQQPGQQPGQPGGQQGAGQSQQQQMQQAMAGMQDQLQQMQAVSQDAQQVAAAQQNAQDAADDMQNQMNGSQPGQGQDQGKPDQTKNDTGPGPKGQGMGKGNKGVGGAAQSAEAPFTVKQEVSHSQDNAKGRIIAATLVKADPIKGESHADTKAVAQAAEQESTDEIDSERVGRPAQKVVRDYFGSLEENDK